jgi:hypothetical protein
MRGPPSGAIQPSIVTMEPTPCVTTAPWRPRLNINRDSGSNTGGSGGGLFQQTQMFGRLNTPGWPDDHNLAVTTSVDSDEDEGQSFGISRDLPLFCTGLFCPSRRVQISHVLPDSTALDRLQAPTNQYKKQHVQLCERLEQLTHKLAHQRTQHIVFMRLQKNGQPRMAVVSKFPYRNCRMIAHVIALSFQVPRL